MRQPRKYVIVGALGLAALAAGLSGCGRAGGGRARLIVATVSRTIRVNPDTHETFAPPPADAAPAMTATEAWAEWEKETGGTNTTIAAGTTVQLGLLTQPVGPDCGAECHGLIVHNGMAYQALNELAYGYSWSVCPADSTLPPIDCVRWIFLDASTGKMINGRLNVGGDPAPDRFTPTG